MSTSACHDHHDCQSESGCECECLTPKSNFSTEWQRVGTFPMDKYRVLWNGDGWEVYVQKGNEAFS